MAHWKSKDNNASEIKSKTLKIGRPGEPTETMEQDKTKFYVLAIWDTKKLKPHL